MKSNFQLRVHEPVPLQSTQPKQPKQPEQPEQVTPESSHATSTGQSVNAGRANFYRQIELQLAEKGQDKQEGILDDIEERKLSSDNSQSDSQSSTQLSGQEGEVSPESLDKWLANYKQHKPERALKGTEENWDFLSADMSTRRSSRKSLRSSFPGSSVLGTRRSSRRSLLNAQQAAGLAGQKRTRKAGSSVSSGSTLLVARRSMRGAHSQAAEMENLKKSAREIDGADPTCALDLTNFLHMNVTFAISGRQVPSREQRGLIERELQNSKRTVYDLLQAVPAEALVMREDVQRGLRSGNNSARSVRHISDRGPESGFRIGTDYTYAENLGNASFQGTRAESDTPKPYSPAPDSLDEQLKLGMEETPSEYQFAHQAAFRLVGGAHNRTVYAPTVANQVIDAYHERFVASTLGGFTFRMDTYEKTTMYSARPVKITNPRTGEVEQCWEVLNSQYDRRELPHPPSPTNQMDIDPT